MKVLSLSQPWASCLFTQHPYEIKPRALKGWETRGWKPSEKNLAIIRKEGLLIHASETWNKFLKELIKQAPFSQYMRFMNPMPFGAIIGKVKVGRILTTESWREEFDPRNNMDALHEKQFGDYTPGRFAWEFATFEPMEPIKCKGALSLWDFDLQTRVRIMKPRKETDLSLFQ